MIRFSTVCLTVYWISIFVATHLPKSSMPSLEYSDKLYHGLAYGGLAFLLACSLTPRPRFQAAAPQAATPQGATSQLGAVPAGLVQPAVRALLIAVTYALFDETTQELVPGRTFDTWDIAADAVGATLGVIVFLSFAWFLQRSGWGRKLLPLLSRIDRPVSSNDHRPPE